MRELTSSEEDHCGSLVSLSGAVAAMHAQQEAIVRPLPSCV